MNNISYYVEEEQLVLEFTSPKDLFDYEISLDRGKLKFKFTLKEKRDKDASTKYIFSLPLKQFVEFLKFNKNYLSDKLSDKKQQNFEIDIYKFVLTFQYSFFDDENTKKTITKGLILNKNKIWSLKNLNAIPISDEFIFYPYITKKGRLALILNKAPSQTQYYLRKTISKIRIEENSLLLEGNLTTRFFDIKEGSIDLIERGGDKSIRFPIEINPHPKQKDNAVGRRHTFKLRITMSELVPFLENLERTEELSLDFFFILKLKETDLELKFRVGNPRFLTNYFMKGEMAAYSSEYDNWLSVVPYFTLKGTNLSLTYNKYNVDAYEYFRSNKRKWGRIKREAKNRNIWIIGERAYKAQDNGLHFFQYLRTNHPEIEAYYVIQKDSPEKRNLKSYGNIIDFNSKEHFEKIIQAKYICGTHHPDSLYPIRSREYIKAISAKKIFLQHGVFGTKNITPIYAKWVNEFSTDLFITSSEKERQLAIIDLEYRPNEVVATGLSRFESLFKKDVPLKRQVVIIPTWRDWITNNEIFENSEYFERYKNLLFDSRLKEFSEKYDVELIFCLHPNMQDYVSYFQDAPITVVKQGEKDVQILIKESLAMITDYSSVAFDFSFLHKPVIYYQFDRQKFLGKYPSHLDLDDELPGDIVFDSNSLIDSLFKIGESNFKMEPIYQEKADAFIKYRDGLSNKRIFDAIKNMPNKNKIQKFFEDDTLILKIKTRFRKSRYYFPTMKVMYWYMKNFSKIKKKRILFESGLGKRYEDSPRAIYEKMVENKEDFEYIWIMNNKEPLKVHPETKIVKRLSVDYFKYLATSQVWINNQNFPTYLKRRKGTKYLQTWHGTPLKKMQHDLSTIEGRDEGYLKRVSNAKDQWTALISPSPYASKAFKSAFLYDSDILELGYPRNDIFYKDDIENDKEKIKQKLGIPDNKKVILYAPTFRDNQKKGKSFIFKNKINMRIFNRRLGNDYVLLIREHVVVASKLKIPEELQSNVIDVSQYSNIQDLMIASDILVTDYSSVMFDYLNTNQPIYFYCYDLDEYDDMRGFYFDFEKEAPGPIIKNTSNLCRAILKDDDYWETYQEKYELFQTKFIPLDGPNRAEVVYKEFFKINDI
jgi:CDP-glycerol glycerophosphotransferase (TagB/SpsB family)